MTTRLTDLNNVNRLTVAERFARKVDTSGGPDACYPWTGAKGKHGYGNVCLTLLSPRKKQWVAAPRLAYILANEFIAEDKDTDHLCHNAAAARGECEGGGSCPHRVCVNPRHLAAKPHRDNVLAGNTTAAANARKTHCKRGHEFTEANTRILPLGNRDAGARRCRRCAADAQAVRDRARRAKPRLSLAA